MDSFKKISIPFFTPTTLSAFINNKVKNTILCKEKILPIIVVKGYLKNIEQEKLKNAKNYNYKKIFNIPLYDNKDPSKKIFINIPFNLYKEEIQEKEVEIFASIDFKSNSTKGVNYFNWSVEVIEIKILSNNRQQKEIEEEISLSNILSKYKRIVKEFPNKKIITIAIIHPQNSKVLEDFKNQLNNIDNINIKSYPVNILNPLEIKEKIEEAKEDIIVIIRGGGQKEDFTIFNDKSLLISWRDKKDAFKISALGHTENSTLLDIFSDIACSTPTEAGKYIKENFERISDTLIDKIELKIKENEKLKNLQQQLEQKFKIINKEFEELKQRNETTNKKLEELKQKNEILNKKPEKLEKENKTLKVVIFILIIIIGLLVFLTINK